MVRKLVELPFDGEKDYIEAAGLSTDPKPSGVVTGSLFMEVDTGDVYAYDEAGTQWDKVAELGGSGS